MTDPRDKRTAPSQPASGLNPPPSKLDEAALQITLTLPLDVVAALRRVAHTSPSQPIEQQIVALLRQALQNQALQNQALQNKGTGAGRERLLPADQLPANQLPANQLPANQAKLNQQSHPSATPDPLLQQELDQIKQRLRLLEAVLPRLEQVETRVDALAEQNPIPLPVEPAPAHQSPAPLPSVTPDSPTAAEQPLASPGNLAAGEQKGNPGSAVASLWMQVQQSDRPPASIPSTLQCAESCPQCQQRLMPFRSSGVMRCIGCGWTRPLDSEAEDVESGTASTTASTSVTGMPEVDIHQLLERAASESMENMKPRKRSS